MGNIRWGIIGCGDVTEVKSGPGFQKADGSELVAVMRRNGQLAADYAARHGVPRWYDDASRLIHDPEVDAVYIATPPASHKDYTILCAEAGKPVYVEKPMALHYGECLEMISACEKAGTPLFTAFYRRALPYFVKVKELLDGGAIGALRFVSMTQYQRPIVTAEGQSLPWRLDPALSGGGLFIDLASHTLDIMDALLGPIEDAQGKAGNLGGHYAAEDIVTGSFRFQSGVQGTGVWCFDAFASFDGNEIVGTKGKLNFSTFGAGTITLTTASGAETFEVGAPPHVQQPLIQTMVNELNGVGRCPSTGRSAARTSRMIDLLLQTYNAPASQA